MLNWKKALLPAAVLAIAIPAAAYAATDNAAPAASTAPDAGTTTTSPSQGKGGFGKGGMMEGRGGKHHGGHHGFAKGARMDDRGVHHSAYLGLLAEKYAPEAVAEWNAVLAEQAKLQQQLRELAPGLKGKGLHGLKGSLTAEELEARKALQTQFSDAVASKDAARIKEALASLLAQQKKDNEQLAARIAEAQASQTSAAAAPQV